VINTILKIELVSDRSPQKQLRSKLEVLITHSMLRFSSTLHQTD